MNPEFSHKWTLNLKISDLHSFLVNIYLPVCKMFFHFKSIFKNIYLKLGVILSFPRQQNN